MLAASSNRIDTIPRSLVLRKFAPGRGVGEASKTADLSTTLRFGRDDKFVATLISDHLADLSSRPKRSAMDLVIQVNPLIGAKPEFAFCMIVSKRTDDGDKFVGTTAASLSPARQ